MSAGSLHDGSGVLSRFILVAVGTMILRNTERRWTMLCDPVLAECVPVDPPDEFDDVDAVRQLAEALVRADSALSRLAYAERCAVMISAECDPNTAPYTSLNWLKAVCFMLLHKDEMPLAIVVGPRAQRLVANRGLFEQAFQESQADLSLAKDAYRGLRDEVATACGLEHKLTYLQTLDHIRGLVEDRRRLELLMRFANISVAPWTRDQIDSIRRVTAA